MLCPKCKSKNPDKAKFCNECAATLTDTKKKSGQDPIKIKGERKHVTVLFSDMSGYTALSERFDPEEVKEITSKIFGKVAKIISKYEGFVEKYIGDAVVAIYLYHIDMPFKCRLIYIILLQKLGFDKKTIFHPHTLRPDRDEKFLPG